MIFCPNNKKNPVVSHKPSLQEELPLDLMIPPPTPHLAPLSQKPLQLRVISSSSPSSSTLISVALSEEYYFPSVCLLHTGVYRHGNFTEMLHRPGFFLFFLPCIVCRGSGAKLRHMLKNLKCKCLPLVRQMGH